MQMVMFLTVQKPTQRNRYRRDSGGLPGFEGVACMERSTKNLGYPISSCSIGKPIQQKEGRLMVYRESDSLIVLRGRESRLHGEGADSGT